jgi:biopolymer transport protein ExbB
VFRTATVLLFYVLLILPLSAKSQSSMQDEFVFLNQELSSLKQRKSKTLKELNNFLNKNKTENQKLERQKEVLSTKVSLLETKMTVFDEERLNKDQIKDQTQRVISQMKDKSKSSTDDFNLINQALLKHLEQGASVYEKPAEALDKEGRLIKGEMLSLGHVISFFKSDKDKTTYYPLARADKKSSFYKIYEKYGFSASRLDRNIGKTIGKTINKTSELSALPVSFLEGNFVKPKNFKALFTDKIKDGGLVGGFIILLGLLGVGLAVLRWINLKTFSNFNSEKIESLISLVSEGQIKEAKEKLSQKEQDPYHKFMNTLLSSMNLSPDEFESKTYEQLVRVKSKVSKFGPYLLVLAGVAPLLGLLGTVTGMIETFGMITTYGTGDPKILSGGIKAALVTTQMGLIVAIPCLLVGNFLNSKAQAILNNYELIVSGVPQQNMSKSSKA